MTGPLWGGASEKPFYLGQTQNRSSMGTEDRVFTRGTKKRVGRKEESLREAKMDGLSSILPSHNRGGSPGRMLGHLCLLEDKPEDHKMRRRKAVLKVREAPRT